MARSNAMTSTEASKVPSQKSGCRMDVTLWQKIAAQTVSDVARINLIVLLLGCCNLMQQQRVSYLDLLCMGRR